MLTHRRVFVAVAAVLLVPLLVAPVLAWVLPFPFHRIFTRTLSVTALLALAFGGAFGAATRRRIGLAGDPRWRSGLAVGAATSALTLVCLYATAIACGPVRWAPRDQAAAAWAVKLLGAAATAVAVALAEEYLFRGLLFVSVRRWFARTTRSPWPAAVTTSAVFALLHVSAFKPPAISGAADPLDALALLAQPVRALASGAAWPAFVGLFLFGVGLSALVLRTRSLFVPLGVHAGVILVVRASRMFVQFPAHGSLWWGTNKVYDGVAGWAALGLLTAILWAWRRPSVPGVERLE